jgi:hypothetical protein
MKATLILVISGFLIGAGFVILWRDLARNRRRAFVVERNTAPHAESDVEITISHGKTGGAPLAASTEPQDEDAFSNFPAQEQRRDPLIEQQWVAASTALEAGIKQVNVVLAPLGAAIAGSGNTRWSFKNRGFGAYRRILINGESIAWLRLEIAHDGKMHAVVRAHKDEHAAINGTSSIAIDQLTPARAGDLLSQCLKPLAAHLANTGGTAEQRASEKAWREVDSVIAAALLASNGALAQAGAKIAPLGPAAWEPESQRHRLALGIDVAGNDVARMHIERLDHEIEIAVGVRDARMVELGRRRRIPVKGLTIHALAELIAGCAWPAIARYREGRRSA